MAEERTIRKGIGGPKSSAGKAVVRLNAVKHGVLAETPVLPLVESEERWEELRRDVLEAEMPSSLAVVIPSMMHSVREADTREEASMQRPTRKPEGFFDRLADFMSSAIGRPLAFMAALAVVVVWLATGPFANFSNTWQLVINTGTTIVTFLMVFLLGNASNRITESQDLMLANIYDEERRLQAEENLIRRLLDRIDVEHIQPILNHLDEQDHQIEAVSERIVTAIEK